MASQSIQDLIAALRAGGPEAPAKLMGRLGISQSTLYRLAKSRPDVIVALGIKRNRELAALRDVRSLGAIAPVFQVSESGEVEKLGELIGLYPKSYAWVSKVAPGRPQIFSGLPYFIDDLRPQGFLGRSFGQRHGDLRLPGRILDWTQEDILEALARRGEDLVGNLIIGSESFDRYQALRPAPSDEAESAHPENHYVTCARAALEGQPSGSSAGGEQPKFGATLKVGGGERRRVLVKFSPTGDSFAAERWRDLLICESLAFEILRKEGVATVEARVLEGGGRTFLETVRFDRVGRSGRRGVLSLAALENEWVGRSENWSVAAMRLREQKKISDHDLELVQKLECFGRFIANTDRHSGNLSFYWSPSDPVARLAPVYDMLPMLYAPSSSGEDTLRTFALPAFDHSLINSSRRAHKLALEYWSRVAQEKTLSNGFRTIAQKNLRLLS